MTSTSDHYAICEAALREGDRDRWLACLFAPESARPHLHALYAFNLEISRIRQHVTQALLGEMRLQFWLDALNGEARGDIRANPTVDALLTTIDACGLRREVLCDLLEARRFDLYDDPNPDMDSLLTYCDLTSGALFQLAHRIVTGQGESAAAIPAGRATALTGLLRAFPWQIRDHRTFLPLDLLQKHGLTPEDVYARRNEAALRSALAEVRDLARKNLTIARENLAKAAPLEKAAFRLAALPPLFLREMERKDYNPYQSLIEPAQWRRQWALWRGPAR